MNNYYRLCNDCIYVDQSNIVVSDKPLYTSHVGTCSVLLFSFNKINFMAHIDALQNNSKQIIKKIKERFDIEKLKGEKIYIIKGSWCNEECITTNIIKNALEKEKLVFLIYKKRVKWNNEIHIKNNKISIK
tara:strand:- start:2 stop:394 length:393 start_codon:yes stop_codon:yes gene_type:complete